MDTPQNTTKTPQGNIQNTESTQLPYTTEAKNMPNNTMKKISKTGINWTEIIPSKPNLISTTLSLSTKKLPASTKEKFLNSKNLSIREQISQGLIENLPTEAEINDNPVEHQSCFSKPLENFLNFFQGLSMPSREQIDGYMGKLKEDIDILFTERTMTDNNVSLQDLKSETSSYIRRTLREELKKLDDSENHQIEKIAE